MPQLFLSTARTISVAVLAWVNAAIAGNEDCLTLDRVHDVRIQMAANAVEALKENLRQYAPAEVIIGINVYANAGVRLKGMGAFLPLDQKPSSALKFNEYERGRKFLGCSKILLNNSLQDASFVSEVFANQLFRDTGLPAPRAAFAKVRFNGRDLGIYTLIEAVNEPFLRREFGNGEGALYEGVVQEIDAGLDQDNGEPSDQRELKALADTARITDSTERISELAKRLDIRQFLRFVAMETLVGHWDGYTMQRSNYRVYHDPPSGKITFIPHGMDQTFREPGAPVWPSTTSLLVHAVLETSEGRRIYADHTAYLAANLFQTNRLTATLDALANVLHPQFRAGGTNALAQWERAFTQYRGRVLRRVHSIHNQLATNSPPSR